MRCDQKAFPISTAEKDQFSQAFLSSYIYRGKGFIQNNQFRITQKCQDQILLSLAFQKSRRKSGFLEKSPYSQLSFQVADLRIFSIFGFWGKCDQFIEIQKIRDIGSASE